MIYSIYRGLTILGAPLIALYLDRRKARGKEDRSRFPERLGHPGQPRPEGALAWLHAASVGESLSMLPLVERLCSGGTRVLVTTGTVTSAKLMVQRLPEGALHQYVPVDRPAYVRRFLDHWRPDLALWAESELWPNMLAELAHRRIPAILVNGRMSPRSFGKWRRVPGFIRRMLSSFALCLAQTESDGERLGRLGAREVRCLGNLKYAVPPLPHDEAELARLQAAAGGRPVWLASSTHPGEEAIAAEAHRALSGRFPDLLTVIAPRHPHRGPDIARELLAMGLSPALRSAGELPRPGTNVYIADTLGELGLFYRLAPVVFMGKSLAVGGGQNPFEPALLGAAVLFGPLMSNFPDMAPRLVEAGAGEQVADGAALAEAVGRLLAEPDLLGRRRAAAQAWARAEAGVLDAVTAALAPYLAQAERRHARP
ncbi:MAG: 3-deoxy-D-manno-octulosonic acid transferase [Actinomycetota bacterium]